MAVIRGNGTDRNVTVKATGNNYGEATLELNDRKGSGIETVAHPSDNGATAAPQDGIYTLGGMRCADNARLPKGIYVVSRNNQVKKHLVK